MKNKQIYTIVALMTFALSGLILMQYQWIKDSLQIKDQAFHQDVHDAMKLIADRLEKLEMANQYGHLFAQDPSGIDMEYPVPVRQNGQLDWLDKNEKRELNELVRQFSSSGVDECNESVSIETQFGESGISINVRASAREQQAMRSHLGKLSRMLSDATTIRDFSQRIDLCQAENVIATTLDDAGLDTEWQYMIIADRKREMLSCSDPSFFTSYDGHYYRKPLLHKDMFSESGRLLLAFPERSKFIISSSSTMLGSSILFNLIIILSFVFTIYTIYRQKKLSEMKTDFINNMTHELKTPISTIKLACEMLADPAISHNESSQKRFAGIIRDENDRLQNHVEKVLQFARLEKGNLKLNVEPVDLHKTINDLIENFALRVTKLNGSIRCKLDATQHLLKADRMHLQNIISNLIDNAIKYTEEQPKIEISTRNRQEGIEVVVKDHGIGMSKETVKRIFDKFYRVPTGDIHNVKGFGLGLSYVKLMVDAHGGFVHADSQIGKGSTISVFLPFEPVELTNS